MLSTRFVILQHRTEQGEHWDLMIDQGESLATWQMDKMLSGDELEGVTVVRLFDHRREYLVYEGPVSGNRGEVRRADEGVCELLSVEADLWKFRLRGRRAKGVFTLVMSDRGVGVLAVQNEAEK